MNGSFLLLVAFDHLFFFGLALPLGQQMLFLQRYAQLRALGLVVNNLPLLHCREDRQSHEDHSQCNAHIHCGCFDLEGGHERVVVLVELFFGEVSASGDGEDGEHDVGGVVIQRILLLKVIVLQVDAALEGDSGIRLSINMVTSTRMKVSSHLLIS